MYNDSSNNLKPGKGSTRQKQFPVCLVSMPNAPVVAPSLALGRLQASLNKAGISTTSHYANLCFLDLIGSKNYVRLDNIPTPDGVYDWLFANAVFGFNETSSNYYLSLLHKRINYLDETIWDEFRRELILLREGITAFIDDTAEQVLACQPKIVGCSSSFQQHVASLALLRRIRELCPEIVTMLGGPNCETIMGQTTHRLFSWVDVVISGEADFLIAPVCDFILKDGPNIPDDLNPGCIYVPLHRDSGYPKNTSDDSINRAIVDDLSTLGTADFNDYFDQLASCEHENLIQPAIPIEFSRGCIWSQYSPCVFCGLNGAALSFRQRPINSTLDELDCLISRYGIKRIEAVDNSLDNQRIPDLVDHLNNKATGLKLFFEVRSNMSRNHILALSEAVDSLWLQPGIESLNSNILRHINKGINTWQNIQMLKWCRQFGVQVGWNLMTCFPGEQDAWYDEMADLIPLLTHLQHAHEIIVRYPRYSTYFENQSAYGLNLLPTELYRYIYPLDNNDIADIVYHFEDAGEWGQNVGAGRPGLARVRDAIRQWRLSWNANPRPTLSLTSVNSRSGTVLDTRPMAVCTSHELESVALRILQLCDSAIRRTELFVLLKNDGIDDLEEIELTITDLRQRGLLVAIDGRFLSLVIEDPVRPLPSIADHAVGAFLPGMFIRTQPK